MLAFSVTNKCAVLLGGQEALEAPNPPFQMVQIADLIPQRLREDYAEAGGKL
jgi:hypothetical protein